MVNCRRQRQKAAWLKGNWEWIVEILREHEIAGEHDFCPSQSTLSRFLSNSHIMRQIQENYFELRQGSDFSNKESGQKSFSIIHYCIDGKSRESCVSDTTGRTEIDVTLMRVDTREVLASSVCPDKEGESITGRKMLEQCGLRLLPGICTFDAGFTNPNFIKCVVNAEQLYIGALKGNAGHVFDIVKNGNWEKSKLTAETENIGHGRKENRTIKILMLSAFPPRVFSKYAKCSCAIKVTREYKQKGKVVSEDRYFIGSKGLLRLSPSEILQIIRDHWSQENGLHWCKDAVLGEDDLPHQSHQSSRSLSFFKSIVVALAFQLVGSVVKFIDAFAASPKIKTQELMFSG